MDTYRIYDGTDELGIVRTGAVRSGGSVLADGLENPVGHGTHL